jgi:predicted enzyme related to lactoylglutathione lyase
MKRVTGIGGVFIKANDPAALGAWYKRHLGIDVQDWGGAVFTWADSDGTPVGGTTVWSVGDGANFAPSNAAFMVNYRVEDLVALLQALRDEGCQVLEETDDSEYGKFGWVIDLEGNKVELWQPPEGQ